MKPWKWLAALAWPGLLAMCAPAWAQAPATEVCDREQVLLGGRTQVHVDETANLTPTQVAQLPSSQFAPLETRELPRYTAAAVWLKLTLRNGSDAPCHRWLHLAKSNVEDQQVHVQQGDGFWRSQRAGNAYPPYEWASSQRLAVFTLALQPGETVQVLARVSSQRSVLVLNPQLYSDAAWLAAQQNIHLIDGLSQGILLLVVGVGFIAGWILRSGMLLALSVGAFFNGLFVCIANGYLFYVPALLPYTELCAAVTGLIAIAGFMIYVQQFYGLSRLPRPWSTFWTRMVAVLLVAYVITRAFGWYDLPMMTSIGLWVIGGFFAVLLHRQRHRAMAWAGAGLMALQLLSQYVFHLDKITPWSADYSPQLALLSSLVWQSAYVQDMSGLLTGAMWLAATLMLEVRASRRREQRAQSELETQRQGELERLEKTVTQRTSQLREALDARRHLLARISHDLRSPLAGIIDMARQPALTMETAWRIEHSARRQLELIDELLEFSRHDLQGPNIATRPGYLYALLHEMEDEARALAKRQGNRFESSIPVNLPIAVSADFYHLRQVLLNLLGNAAKFTRNGRIRLEVTQLGLSDTSVRLRFTVADTGSGIPLAEREKIMRPFGRGANAQGVPGVGLGLSIVRQLLEGMGAELSLDTEPESPGEKQESQGSRFSFVLELSLVHEEDVGQSFMESHATHVEGAGRRILVTDDLAMNRDELADLLGGYGFDVVTAPDGEAAWEKLQAGPFDLLLTDQMMPRMDGWQLLAHVRATYPDLPVLLYSASPPLPPMDWPAQTHFDASLLKPAASGELLQWVDRLTRQPRPSAQMQA